MAIFSVSNTGTVYRGKNFAPSLHISYPLLGEGGVNIKKHIINDPEK
jgi:hypothetical protein